MNRNLAQSLARIGLVPQEMLQQFYRWRLLDEDPGPEKFDCISVNAFMDKLRRILEDTSYALIRETDMDILRRYLSTQKVAKLMVSTESAQTAEIDVAYGTTLTGEYIFPWQGASIADLMTNGLTHLLVPLGGNRYEAVYFSDVSEAFFDEYKAFMVCRASTHEPQEGEDGDRR